MSVGLVALEGEEVIAQLSVTVPVNELDGVTVMVEVPLPAAPALIVMLPLLERVKLLLPPGACQKSPQPATSVAAANNPAQRPIFIAAPFAPSSGCVIHRNPITDYTYTHAPSSMCRRRSCGTSLAAVALCIPSTLLAIPALKLIDS